jgi:hypothetical protein
MGQRQEETEVSIGHLSQVLGVEVIRKQGMMRKRII